MVQADRLRAVEARGLWLAKLDITSCKPACRQKSQKSWPWSSPPIHNGKIQSFQVNVEFTSTIRTHQLTYTSSGPFCMCILRFEFCLYISFVQKLGWRVSRLWFIRILSLIACVSIYASSILPLEPSLVHRHRSAHCWRDGTCTFLVRIVSTFLPSAHSLSCQSYLPPRKVT